MTDSSDATTQPPTVTASFAATVARHPDATALRWRGRDRTWHTATWREYGNRATAVAAGLGELGIDRGARVVLLLRNRPEFHFADTGALLAGAVPISLYNSTPVPALRHLLHHSGAYAAIADDSELLERLLEAREAAPGLHHLVVVDDRDSVAGDDVVGFEQLSTAGAVDLESAAAHARPDELATVIYTSGTTGPPKGVMVSHANIGATTAILRRAVSRTVAELAGKRVVSYLPMAHVAERMISHYEAIDCGLEVTTCPEVGLIGRYLPETRPHIAFGVPRIWERIHDRVNATLPDASPATIREALGLDEAEFVFTGSAPTAPALIEWFRAAGVPMTEIYGLSETTGAVAAETDEPRPGWAGRPLTGVEVQLAGDGEILVRGPNVVSGYLDDTAATDEAFDADGWFRTGDLGELDSAGYLRVVDRKKELIVTAGGKKVSPANLEAALKTIPLVAHAAVIGDGRPYIAALVVLDRDAVAALQPEAVDARLADGIAAVNRTVTPPERIHQWAVVADDWTADSDLLTATMKLKRRDVEARYAVEIAALYDRG